MIGTVEASGSGRFLRSAKLASCYENFRDDIRTFRKIAVSIDDPR